MIKYNDGLVYNYGNSLSANFTGDAKNVIKIANIIYFWWTYMRMCTMMSRF